MTNHPDNEIDPRLEQMLETSNAMILAAEAHSLEAFERIIGLMRHGDGPVALEAAKIIIERAFGSPSQTINNRVESDPSPMAPLPPTADSQDDLDRFIDDQASKGEALN